MTRRTALSLSFLLPAALASAGPLDGVRRDVLPNGLTVLVLPEPGSPFVSVGTMYRVGAKNEAAGTTGIAHYCEHMNFRATRHFPGHETTDSVTRRGGRWSGYTWIDQTWYASTMEADALDHLLAVEADRMTEALYDPAEFDKERASVLAELHSYDDPHSLLYDAVLAASFAIHPYRNNTIGDASDVERITRDEAYRFYRRFYHPNNAVLVVASGLPPEAVLDRVRAHFGALPSDGETTAIRTIEPVQTGQRRVTLRLPGPHAELLVAFRAPALGDPDFPVMVLFDSLLAGGKDLDCWRSIRRRRELPWIRLWGVRSATDERPGKHPLTRTSTASRPPFRELKTSKRVNPRSSDCSSKLRKGSGRRPRGVKLFSRSDAAGRATSTSRESASTRSPSSRSPAGGARSSTCPSGCSR